MGSKIRQSPAAVAWSLVKRQHGVIARGQLLALGLSSRAIQHRLSAGRLHPVHLGVYAVGRPQFGRLGRLMAAVLACGEGAALSHGTAAELWRIRPEQPAIEVSIRCSSYRRRPGIVIHRRPSLAADDFTRREGIPVTSVARTVLDLATRLDRDSLEAAINQADKLDLIDPDRLRAVVDERAGQAGVAVLRRVLDRRTFVLTDSALERRFLRLVRSAGLPSPSTGVWLNGFKVDFYWPDFGLVVETDGLRYHRTAAQQERDRLRDQAQARAGLTPLRFTHAQVRFEPDHVQATLRTVARRCAAR
jgi:very-short-patch-repair endonuclease